MAWAKSGVSLFTYIIYTKMVFQKWRRLEQIVYGKMVKHAKFGVGWSWSYIVPKGQTWV